MVGKEYEHAGIAKHGAKLVTAVSTCSVPKYTVILGGSFGAGNYGMCGRAFDPKFLFTWPQSRISVMGGTQAAEVLTAVQSASSNPKSTEELKAMKASIEQEYFEKGNAFYATSQLWDDGIIDPAKTRDTLGLSLAASHFDQTQVNQFGIFRM